MTSILNNVIPSPAVNHNGYHKVALTAVGVGLDRDSQGFLERFAESSPWLRLRPTVLDYAAAELALAAPPTADMPAVWIIDFDGNRANATRVATRIRAHSPECAIFAVSSRSEPGSIIEAMRSGCTEYLVKPVTDEQLAPALSRAQEARLDRKETLKGTAVALIGAKGGCGVTTLITQLGCLMAASRPRKVLLLDLHSDFGDAALYLGLRQYRYHSHELLESVGRLDTELLQGFVLQHESGLDVIPAPENAEPQRRLDPSALVRTLDFLRSRYEYILLDCPPGLTPETLELVRYCDKVYFITVPEVAAVRNVTRHVNYFMQQGIPREKCEVVLNRHQRHSLISDTQIEKAIGASLSRRIPNEYMQAINVITAGAPASVPESSDMRQSLKEWAEALGGGTRDERSPKRGLLSLWGR